MQDIDRPEKIKILTQEIKALVSEARAMASVSKFRTKLGGICVRPVTEVLNKDLLKFSVKEIREILSQQLKE